MGDAPFVRVGRVAKAFGLKGEVSVVPTTDLPFDLLIGLDIWFVPPGEGLRSARLQSVRQGPKGPLFTLAEVTDADAASALRGKDVAVRETDLPEGYGDLAFDPVGLTVIDETRGTLGEVVDVIVTGANDVWIVEGGQYGQILVPVIEQVVLQVDDDGREVRVRLIPGLIEGD